MKAIRFRVENFRNIEDSGWIPLNDVTAFVGRNEAGKTALLKALHLFNPATSERFIPKQDYPRDRYVRDWPSPDDEKDWPVCHVEFIIDEDLQSRISSLLPANECPPARVIVTRHYDHSLHYEYEPPLRADTIDNEQVTDALRNLAASAQRYREPRKDLATWANDKRTQIMQDDEAVHHEDFVDTLCSLHNEANNYADDVTVAAVERFQGRLDALIGRNEALEQVSDLVSQEMPIFIYFENYGVLDSAVWLPRFVEDLDRTPHDARIRTLNAMFKHANLDPRLITELDDMRPNVDDPDNLDDHQAKKDERAIRLNSASIEISNKFSSWWKQRRHKIRYHADGGYFRIYVADDRKQDVDIELEARSKGFQWFFSFYLVFLVESEDQHKNAILLLDEPGLHLHPTAQQELIVFFDELAKSNQLIYTTHSPFLIDGNNLHRIRPVVEEENGTSAVSVNSWPADRETMFPVQAAAGYAIMKSLFKHQKNLLVEGITDYHYLHALSQESVRLGRHALPDDIVVTPCGGTSNIGYLASLFRGHEARPVILLDDDEAGRNRGRALLRNLFGDRTGAVLVLGNILGIDDRDVEMEDIVGENLILKSLREALGMVFEIEEEDRRGESSRDRSLPHTIKAATERNGIQLPEGWKLSVAIWIVSALAKGDIAIEDSTASRADRLFDAIRGSLSEAS